MPVVKFILGALIVALFVSLTVRFAGPKGREAYDRAVSYIKAKVSSLKG